ncbi:MAG TPA: aldehyde ferredoxin oxidoreductase N-terminal domain-containing protein [Tenuifilaceae bacterium]|nr:aldehyde ferredoxin oxidoreductase N-terminal domain-containing protein [Tenuifilaceae bacterium]
MDFKTHTLKCLMVDASNGYYRINRYKLGDFFGPVDLGIHLSYKYNSLNVGTGILAGSIFPGSNRLIFNGISPSWHGFYISSMGGAGLVFDNLGINMFSIVGKSFTPSLLYLNRIHGEEIEP